MDIRLITESKIESLKKSKYKGDYIFAFDNIEDKEIIEKSLVKWKKRNKENNETVRFLCI